MNFNTVHEKGSGYTALQIVVIISCIFISIFLIVLLVMAAKVPAVLIQLPFMLLGYVWIYLFNKVAKAAFIARDFAIESELRKDESS